MIKKAIFNRGRSGGGIVVLLIFIAFLFSSTAVQSRIINIPEDYPTIQQGINASQHCDTVLVQPGTYEGNLNFGGRLILLCSMYPFTGDTTYISSTIIDGGSTHYGIVFNNGESRHSVVDGFTIQNGTIGIKCEMYSWPTIRNNYIINHNSEGIYCYYGSDPYIMDNKIIGNGYFGIHAWMSEPYVSGNIVSENAATGIYIDPDPDSDVYILNNIARNNGINGIWIGGAHVAEICNNIAEGNDASGIYGEADTLLISGNISMGNSSGYGAGIVAAGGDLIICGNLVVGNHSSGSGGGVAVNNATLVGNTICGNRAEGFGGGLYVSTEPNEAATLINSIVWSNEAVLGSEIYAEGANFAAAHSDIKGGWEGEGNLDTLPLFRDPDNGDYHLMAVECDDPYDSPCIDAGNPAFRDSLHDCDWGLGSEIGDMGAYGGFTFMDFPVIWHPPISMGFTQEDPLIVQAIITDDDGIADVFVFYGTGAGFDSLEMVNNYGNVYSTTFPVFPARIEVSYYIRATETGQHNLTSYYPPGGASDPVVFPVVEGQGISYDSLFYGWSFVSFDWDSNSFAVRMTPSTYPVYVNILRAYIYGTEDFMFSVNDFVNGMPGAVIGGPWVAHVQDDSGWFNFPIPYGEEVEINEGDFCVVAQWQRTSPRNPYIGVADFRNSNGRSYYFYSQWVPSEFHNFMIRCAIFDSNSVSVEELPGTPIADYSLLDNYPNPFNSTTIIRYAIPCRSRVRLEVFNLLGQRVEKLLDTRQQAGQHSVAWDASRFASGIYFYRLTAHQGPGLSTAGDFISTKRMTIVK
jgi:parallel beta-helix repeat protein